MAEDRGGTPIRDGQGRIRLTVRRLKASMVIDPAQLAQVTVADGAGPQRVVINLGDRQSLNCTLNPKSLRRAIRTIQEHGPEQMTVVLQGVLDGSQLEEAGIAAQVKTPKT